MAVSVVIPAYNEAAAVKNVVVGVADVLRDCEIIVVDDGSTDRTAEMAREAGAKVVSMGKNSGYGAALKAGIKAAANDLICIMDCDSTYSPSDIPRLLERAGRGVMAVGVRKIIWKQVGRNAYKFFFNRFVSLLARSKVRDINSGLRAFDRRDLMKNGDLLCDRFSFSTSSTIIYLLGGMRVEYVGIDYSSRVGKSKMRPRDAFRLVAVALRTARAMRRRAR